VWLRYLRKLLRTDVAFSGSAGLPILADNAEVSFYGTSQVRSRMHDQNACVCGGHHARACLNIPRDRPHDDCMQLQLKNQRGTPLCAHALM
jgi:hypothetical protein